MKKIALIVASLLAGCGGGGGAAPLSPPPSNGFGSQLLLYPGHAPMLVPGTQPGTTNATLTLGNSGTPGPGYSLPGGAQYLVYESNYTGSYTVANSCAPAAVAQTSFETEITPQPGAGGYSFKPAPTGSGPGAILDVTPSGVLGAQTCTLKVSDTVGNSVSIAVTNNQLLLYPDTSGGFGPGLTGTGFYLDASFVPTTLFVYEQGYSGGYTLEPYTCSTFKATLTAPVDAGSPALLTLSANGPPTLEGCTFTATDSHGRQAVVAAYYEGVP